MKSLLKLATLSGVAVVLLAGCSANTSGAPGAPGASGASATEAPAPAKTPFVAPDWESQTYESEEHGFSVHYPSDFAESPATGGGLFSAASPNMVPRLDLTIVPMPPTSSLEDVGAALESAMAQVGGGEAKVTASKAVTLKDDVTEGMEFALDWTFQGFPLSSVIVGAPSATGESSVTVMVTGMQGGDMAELADNAYTLYVD
ncbi:MAG: hypothetical protein AAGK22_27355 [Acidobacteriota bacterium]